MPEGFEFLSREARLWAPFAFTPRQTSDEARARNFVERALENARSLPGVKRAGITTYLPFGGGQNANVMTIEGYTLAPGENPPVPGFNRINGDYFQAMGIPLLRGRTFEETDRAESQGVAIIDQFLARKYWPKGEPVGAKIRRGIGNDSPALTVVGAYFLTRIMASLLYQVKPTDPAVFPAVSALLAGVAGLASLAPSLRATRVDPVVALRYE
jgi:hypothetical protein